MVITSSTGSQLFTETGLKLRRSRRLSSTRGLQRDSKNIKDSNPAGRVKPDLNQKLGLCPIVCKNVDDEDESNKRHHINWELNERISLSSGSSPGIEIRPDVEKGIEFSDSRRKTDFETKCKANDFKEPTRIKGPRVARKGDLELMNVSGFPANENVIKSDSKYEVVSSIDPSIVKKRNQKKKTGEADGIKTLKLKERVNVSLHKKEALSTAQKRWISAKEKVDKTNESISKRLELIHELNQKILANYERFHRKNKRSHLRDSRDSEEEGTNFKKEGSARSLSVLEDDLKECEEMYSKIMTKRKCKNSEERGEDLWKQKIDINKFTFSRDYCEKLVSTPKTFETVKKNKTDGKFSRETDDNFSLSAKPEFSEHQKEVRPHLIEKRSNVSRSVFYVQSDDNKEVKEAFVTPDDRLENSKLYPDTGMNVRRSYRDEVKIQNGSVDQKRLGGESLRKKDSPGRTEMKETQEPNGKESKDTINFTKVSTQEEILQNEILKNLNDTIGRFDTEKSNDTHGSDSAGKNDSFSTDSIQSLSPITSSKSPANTTLQETFNSSWDSGVGVEVGSGSGWVRVHTGIESSLVYLTLDTTSKDVCRDMLLGEELSLFIQYGGEAGRRLSPHEKPLELQDAFLQRLGYQEPSRRARLGVDPELRHLISFHVGPAAPLNDLIGYSHCGYVLVLKGLVFPQWKRRVLAVIGSRLFLYPACTNAEPEWMELGDSGGAVCYAPSRLGKLVLRVTGFPRIVQHELQSTSSLIEQIQEQNDTPYQETRHLYLGFHHPWDRDLWRCWLKQASQLSSCPKRLDMSRGGLSRIPDSTVAFPAIEELVLGQNQLSNSNSNLSLLQRFPKLQAVYLESNNLPKIPWELIELQNLRTLNLSDNQIEEIPQEICELVNLQELNLDRNGIKELPEEVGELRHLKSISLAGNSISHLPSFLKMRALTITDVLSKGDNTKPYKDEKNNQNNLQKINLRNNQLKGSIILGNYGNLTHLDVSENSIEKLDISALQELRSVRCARNSLTELTVCGRNLVSLIAGNNRLKKLTIDPVPTNLEHLDVSYNSLDSLPEWTPEVPVLRALFASHNALTALPDRLLSQPSRLEVLHLPHNRLQALPPPRRPLNIVHLTLQGNALTALPTSFFTNTEKLKVLNLSNNRLSELPFSDQGCKNRQICHTLEKLYLTGNCLTDTALDALSKLTSLRVLHIAYNVLDTLPESCIASWAELEELVLSGNRLQYLPDNVANLQHLRVLRVHSNRLLTCPTFNKTTSLKVLDLAHNQLDRVNLATLVPPQLQFLDISCNTRLHVDPRQFQVYRSQRPVSLVDVSGQNRPSLPSHPQQQETAAVERGLEQPWRLGFSETAGTREKLYVSQIRMPSFCNVEGLFGIFDGGSNQEAPSALQEMIPRLLLEERTIRETSNEYLKYTLLSAHQELKEKGQKYGIDATLCHITRLPNTQGYPRTTRKYSLKVASSGDAKAVLCRAAGPLTLATAKKTPVKNQLGNAAMFPLVVPDPTAEEVLLEDDDEFVIIANRRLWEVLSVQEAVREARAEASPVLAAKRLQDLAQAYGAEDNVSIIVVRLTGPGQGDMDQLMRELRQAVSKNRNQNEGGCSCPCCLPPTPHKPPAPCCCHVNNEGYYLNGVLKNIVKRPTKSHNGSGRFFKNSRAPERPENESPSFGDDRSSPSGQSDQTSDSTFKSRRPSGRTWTGSTASRVANKVRQNATLQESVTRKSPVCVPVQDDVVSERSGALSDEQFRCWEYMLEQNTQLLFDKELDTLTRSPLRRGQSRSTPQLAGNLPFLSKRFGSARSFNPVLPRSSMVRFGSGRRLLNGGPNAAYFGSLQRLMPYNLEYDFAVIQERSGMDSLEQDASRMQQYWGVATTEL